MKVSDFFRRKLVQDAEDDTQQNGPALKKVLGPFDLTMNGIAAIIGAGIFVVIGDVVTNYAGPGIWVSMLLAGFAAALVAFAYAELAGMIPSAGSSYAYAYATLGEAPAFLIGWSVLLAYGIGISAVAAGLPGYLNAFLSHFGLGVPAYLGAVPPLGPSIGAMLGVIVAAISGLALYRGLSQTPKMQTGKLLLTGLVGVASLAGIVYSVSSMSSVNLIAVALISLLTLHQYHGVKESVRLNTIMSVVESGLVVVFLAMTIFHADPANLTPVAPFGWGGIATGAALIFLAFIGFESITMMGDEARNPRKDLPKAIMSSLAVCTVLYVLVGLAIAGAVSYKTLDANAPMVYVLTQLGYGWAVSLFALGVVISIKSTLNVLIYSESRLLMRMAKDGLLPSVLSSVGEKRRTPYAAIFTVGVLSAAAAGLFPIGALAELVVIGVLSAFVAVCIGVIVLRRTHPLTPRNFRCPLVPVIPGLGILVCLGLIWSLAPVTKLLFLGWIATGLVIYLAFGRRNSTLTKQSHTPESD